jgi:GH15 family glucan-1,4-alpha-glucosidase
LEVDFEDVIYNEKNIFIREVTLKNLFDHARKVKIFFNQQFNIGETIRRDTAYYSPKENSIIHYEGRRVFLINVKNNDKGFDNYSVGLMAIEGKEGTFRDAEDGELSGSPIEHGQVDSTIEVGVDLDPKAQHKFHYWMAIAKSVDGAKKLNDYVIKKTPKYLIGSTKNYWKAWVNNQNFTFYGLNNKIIDLFKRSLFIIRTHVSDNGSIVASSDSDMLQYGRDTYSYMWPRDAAMSAIALVKAGDFNASKRFFEFCNDVITDEGYFMHKYRPDKSVGSSWHPWIREGKPQLPIQEDETALVINALWKYFEHSKDLEFVESIYNSLVKNAAEFMVSYRNEKTGLPKPSYDLWEMKYGTHTFTAASVYGALEMASRFAKLLGKEKSADKYLQAAAEIKDAIIEHLYDEKEGVFVKSSFVEDGKRQTDKTIDISSVYGVYNFGVLEMDDERLKKAFEKTIDKLSVKTDVGGIARFEGDSYHSRGGNIPGNPWLITTLWTFQNRIAQIKEESEIPEIVEKLMWVEGKAQASGVLPEQLDPYSGDQVSAAPLTWSHAEYVITVIQYLEKLEELDICKACYPLGK